MRRSALGSLTRRVGHLQDLGLVRSDVGPDVVALAQLGMLEEAIRSLVLEGPAPGFSSQLKCSSICIGVASVPIEDIFPFDRTVFSLATL